MNKTVKWILIGVGVLVLLVVLSKLFTGNSQAGIKVTAEKAQERTIIETVNASGKVYPEIEVPISPDISGEVTELVVQEGDSVKKGQMLARIYADIYSSQRDEAIARVAQSQATEANSQAAIEALKAQLDQDRLTLNRNKELYDQKVISKAEFEGYDTKFRASQAQYNAALQNIKSLRAGTATTQSGLVMANKNLGRATITAPIDGVITSLKVKRGEKVVGTAQMAGTDMMTVSDLSKMEVRVDVGENDIVKVAIGNDADVQVEAYNSRKFHGTVTQIASSTAKAGSTTASATGDVTSYQVHIRLDPTSYKDLIDPLQPKKFPFRPGMNASADIKTNTRPHVVSVPIVSVAVRIKGSDDNIDQKKKELKKGSQEQDEEPVVASDDTEEVVFVIGKDNKLERRKVTSGIQDINYIEITGGLKPGEQVVTGPYSAISKTLKSGKVVQVVRKDQLFEQ